jgi:hypothetical protein
VTVPDDFEQTLRTGLATLAREAVPDAPASLPTLPPMRTAPSRSERRIGPRLLAAGIAIAVATASVVVALAVHGTSHTPIVEPTAQWTKVTPSPLSPRSSQIAVFTGRDVIVWGGRSDSAGNVAPAIGPNSPRYTLADGAAYDVPADRWRVLPPAPIAGRYDAVAGWTGTEMLVVGGQREGGLPRDGAAYNPSTRRWRVIPDAPTCPTFGTWTGTQLIVGGACTNGVTFAAYNPVRNRWERFPAFASATQLVAAGGRLYAWASATARGAVYDAHARRWRTMPAMTDSSNPLQDSVAVAYRDRVVVVGRDADPPFGGADAGRIALLGPQGWTSSAEGTEGPPLVGSVVASANGAVVWSSAMSLAAVTIDPTVRSFSFENVGDGAPIQLDRLGESLVGIGYRRFMVWGGRLAGTAQDPTNRPTADGAIVRLP